MNKFVFGIIRIAPVMFVLMSGCELSTPPGPPPRGKQPGNNLVLNEVFTISPDKYYAYSWIEIFNPTDHKIPWLDDVYPINTYALGSGGSLMNTDDVDAGEWTQKIQGDGQTYNNLDFYYPDTAFACGNGGVLKKYKHIKNPSDPSDPGIFLVEDLVSGTTRNINDCQFVYLNAVGYLVGDGGLIKRSLNRGVAWTDQVSGVSTALRSLAFIDFGSPPRIWTCGDAGVVLRKAGGTSWTRQTVPADKAALNFYGMVMTTDTGFVVGEQGSIIFTRSGGTNWASKTSGVTSTLRSAFMGEDLTFFVRGRAWVVGDNGVILRTDDYGDNWTKQSSGTSARLNRVVFGDSIRGAAFGDGGTVVNTTDGGHSWHSQNSGTAENLVAATMLPLTIKVENYYVLEMVAKRKTFYTDFTVFPPVLNYDYFTHIDTGAIVYDPQLLFNVRLAPKPKDVQAYSFIILNSDSTRFKDHVKLGPGQTQLQNVSIAYVPDSVAPHPVLWDLLAAGEIRLVKYYVKQTTGGQPIFLGFERKVIDLVRYGNFIPTTALYPLREIYPNNQPLGFIPEGYSIARYANDGGGKPAAEQSTAYSFYLSADPIPGWFSQESRP